MRITLTSRKTVHEYQFLNVDVDVVLPSTVALMDVEFVEAEDPTSRDA